jgi:hypothetical protein
VLRRLSEADVDVVAVKGDVELAERQLRTGKLGDPPAEALCERHPAGVDADEGDALEVGIPLDDLVRDPRQRTRDRVDIEDDLGCRGLRGYPTLRA